MPHQPLNLPCCLGKTAIHPTSGTWSNLVAHGPWRGNDDISVAVRRAATRLLLMLGLSLLCSTFAMLHCLKALRHGPPTQSDYVHFRVHNVVPRRLGTRPTVYVRAANLPARVKRSRHCLCSSSTASLHAQLPHLDLEPSTSL